MAGFVDPRVVLFVDLRVRPEYRTEFLEAIWQDAHGALENEEGCLAFEVTIDSEDPNHFHLYEVYRDADARTIHRAAPYLKPVSEGLDRWLSEASTLIVANYQDPSER